MNHTIMRSCGLTAIIRKYLLLFLSAVFFAAGFLLDSRLSCPDQAVVVTKKFERRLHQQEALLGQYLEQVAGTIEQEDFDGNLQSAFHHLSSLFSKNGLGFLITDNQKLLFWSNQRFAFERAYLKQAPEEKVQFLPNGVYLSKVKKAGNLSVIGLIPLKETYPIRNDYIANRFAKGFDTPDTYKIEPEAPDHGVPVRNAHGEYVFSLVPGGKVLCEQSQLYLPALLFFTALILLLFFIRSFLKSNYTDEPFLLRMLVLALVLLGLYWIHVLFRIPRLCYAFDLFGPSLYACSFLLPSLGDLLLFTIFIVFWSFHLAEEYRSSGEKHRREFMAAFGFTALFYLAINLLIKNLIRNSSFSFYLNRIDDINLYSLLGYLIIALLLLSAFLINLKFMEAAGSQLPRRKFLIVHIVLSSILILLSFVLKNSYLYVLCLFVLTNLSGVILQKTHIRRFSMPYFIYFVALFTLFSLLIIQNHQAVRRQEVQKLMAITRYSEHDPSAEMVLTETQQQINVDSIIPYLLTPPYKNLEEYMTQEYFSGYLRKYDLQITICDGSDSLLVQPDNRMVPCFPYFDEMIRESGVRIPRTNFYYMENMNGRISYFGKLFYPLSSDSLGVSIFIDLQSKLLPKGIGFPELLLDRSMKEPEGYKHFSYAKYYNKELVHLNGDYPYNFYISPYLAGQDTSEFLWKKWDHYDHLIYNLGKDNYIIVSIKSFGIMDYLVSFPYLFVFYFGLLFLLVFAGNPAYRRLSFSFDLKFRIQAAIITVVLISLLVVAVGTIYYNSREYVSRHQAGLNEKMQAIAEEISMRLNTVNDFTPDIRSWLWSELSEMSNIFLTDINIYGTDGKMIATSRPEIMNRGIISDRMDSKAFYELTQNYRIRYMQPERIGGLAFLSVYEPIINHQGSYLGFINLPYFSKGDELRQEISTFIVAFINLYALLFFGSVIVAVLLANKITLPLSLIRIKLKGIQLGKKNEHINYSGDDEIGALVKEYNRKVVELAESAERLARSERELAWREMAKQVAHEIKNPLTPMKLNIQYLQRAKTENSPHYDEFFNRVTRTLIEQIDTLSDIATEFSNFAKIPETKNEVFNLAEKLNDVAALFESNSQTTFTLNLHGLTEVLINADREQLSRALINLIKNAIQSIPPGRRGKVTISLTQNDDYAVITVRDNGTGIPEEIRHQMFRPNFTTKTSGMGLGLAIVMKIAETFHWRIWYETAVDKGTAFFIELPVYS
ncbi:MAG: ATP-binding protein [Mangrovibacterium sp.]|nr:ATP-binding protein [Mangrovibacterium sp.]